MCHTMVSQAFADQAEWASCQRGERTAFEECGGGQVCTNDAVFWPLQPVQANMEPMRGTREDHRDPGSRLLTPLCESGISVGEQTTQPCNVPPRDWSEVFVENVCVYCTVRSKKKKNGPSVVGTCRVAGIEIYPVQECCEELVQNTQEGEKTEKKQRPAPRLNNPT